MRRSPPLIAAVALVLVLSALAVGCGGSSQSNKPGLVTSWGTDGVVKLVGFKVKQTLEDGSGRIVAIGDHGGHAQVVRLLPSGSLDSSFGESGRARWPSQSLQGPSPPGLDNPGWDRAALLPDGRIVLAGTNTFGDIYGEGNLQSTLVVSEIDQSGRVVKDFGQNGYFTADKQLYRCPPTASVKVDEACQRHLDFLARKKTTCTRGPAGLAIQEEKIVVSADRFCNDLADPILHIVVMRLNANGTRDRSFGQKGEVTVSRTAPLVFSAPLIVLRNDHLVVAGTTPKGGKVQLTELLPNGAIDRSFGRNGVVFTKAAEGINGFHDLTALMIDEHGALSLLGNNDQGPFLVRFTSLGRPLDLSLGSRRPPSIRVKGNYENFGGATLGSTYAVFAQLSSGELVGAGNRLARITSGGVFDPSYPSQRLYGGGKLIITTLIADSDGTVLVTLLNPNSSSAETVFLARYR
jgi:uncharacterized delta-60 repeat protein